MPGPTLGRYRLHERIAQGGMGEVYRGVDVGFGGVERPIAVKLIAPALARDPGLTQQFIDEAKLSFLLCHQNVVQVRDVGEIDGQFFIAMEWVDGADLGTILTRLKTAAGQPLPLRFATLVAVEAARGLDYAHRLRDASGRALHLVHRDVSPSNLLVSFEGEIKVTDFGIARSRLREPTSLPGALKGKVGYMAPEQARGEALDVRADVFALGVVLYEMLTGVNPFLHEARDNEALERVRQARFMPVRTLAPSVPQGLEAIVLRAMAAARDERYQTCDKMREDLEQFARREAYALSPSDFGQFVRDLLEAAPPAEVERHKTQTPPKRLSGTRAVATPRAFNDALGGALAALGGGNGGDDDDAADAAVGQGDVAHAATQAVGAVAGATLPGRRVPTAAAAPKRTVALHQPVQLHETIAAPAEAERPSTDLTDLIPRSGSRVPIVVAIAALVIAGAAGAAWYALRPAPAEPATTVPTTSRATVVSAPATSRATTTSPTSATNPTMPATPLAADDERAHEHHRARAAAHVAPAHLTITSDVAADAFVDGQYVRATPIVDYELPPGRHTVHLESAAPGLRLIPREQTVVLEPGELKQLRMELK